MLILFYLIPFIMAFEIWYILKDEYTSRFKLFLTVFIILVFSIVLFAILALFIETDYKQWYHDALAVIMMLAIPALCAKIYKEL